jgi:hypothetical protein
MAPGLFIVAVRVVRKAQKIPWLLRSRPSEMRPLSVLTSQNHKRGPNINRGSMFLIARCFRRIRCGLLLRFLNRRADFGAHREEHYASAYLFRIFGIVSF